MDNNVSKIVKESMDELEIWFQLALPGNYQYNKLERGIKTLKDKFIVLLYSIEPIYPVQHWGKLFKKSTIILNIAWYSRIDPTTSAYINMFGDYDFNATTMAPPGTKFITHNKPGSRSSWAPDSTIVWYARPAIHHYRCRHIIVLKTLP